MEMNTRLQVEHTITELITGIDLVKEQIKIAEGKKMQLKQSDVSFHDAALQCRVMAQPAASKMNGISDEITRYHLPGGYGVRVDSGYENNMKFSYIYDSLLCKICCHGSDRNEVIHTMRRCLKELKIEGIETNKDT